MAFEIVFKPIALVDADEAAAWYEKELNGLGKRFLLRLSETLDKLKENPHSHLVISDPVRRILLKSFPYKILYFIKDNSTIVVIGIIHMKRSKRYYRSRMKL